MNRLDREDDFELLIDFCMLAASHLFNAALHVEGVTHQHADHGHVNLPPLEQYSKQPSKQFYQGSQALEAIEGLRERYVRGGEDYDPNVIEACLASYEEATICFLQIIGEKFDEPFWAHEALELQDPAS